MSKKFDIMSKKFDIIRQHAEADIERGLVCELENRGALMSLICTDHTDLFLSSAPVKTRWWISAISGFISGISLWNGKMEGKAILLRGEMTSVGRENPLL